METCRTTASIGNACGPRTEALVLRFEFMGTGFMKAVAYLATASLCVITWIMMSDVLSG